MTGKWKYDQWKSYEEGKGFIQISYDDYNDMLYVDIGYKKNALDYSFEYERYY